MPIRRAGIALLSVQLSLSVGAVSYSTLPSSLFGCWSSLVFHSPILPSCLDSFSSPPMRPGITSLLSVLMSLSCPPSLTMSSTMIVVRVSHFHNKCTPCHLMSSLLPCLLAFKNRRSSKMILRIVAPLVTSIDAAATLKQDLCQPDGSLIFRGHVADAIFLRGETGYQLRMAVMANSIFSGVSQRRRVWILAYCQTIPPPPPKGQCLECASMTLLRLAGR